ncbi:MAG: GNAT family N-acetyltransferase [Rubrivivax sp.]|nr:GNAT family N-acetyltransferase [Rubrivivax sp.]
MNLAPSFRLATSADVPTLAALYADAARKLGGWCYTPEQVAAWSAFGADTPAFRDYVLGSRTWVAQRVDGVDGDITGVLGFCGIDDHGHVHSLYVRADHNRRGLGTALLAHAMADARQRGLTHFSAWCTPLSEPVFARAGLVVVERPLAEFEGVAFRRCRMATPGTTPGADPAA